MTTQANFIDAVRHVQQVWPDFILAMFTPDYHHKLQQHAIDRYDVTEADIATVTLTEIKLTNGRRIRMDRDKARTAVKGAA